MVISITLTGQRLHINGQSTFLKQSSEVKNMNNNNATLMNSSSFRRKAARFRFHKGSNGNSI